MAYKSARFQDLVVEQRIHDPNTGNDRVNRIIQDINNLTQSELLLLTRRLNDEHQTSPRPHTNQAPNKAGIRLDGKCVRLLSRREIDVLTLVAAGYSRKEIGESLDITSNTAAKHVSSIYRKLNISNIAEATRIALENGILSSDSIGAQ